MSPDQLTRWETGESQPIFLQAQKLAQGLHTPLGYLFLAEPPTEGLSLPDRRTVGTAPVPRPSIDLPRFWKNPTQPPKQLLPR